MWFLDMRPFLVRRIKTSALPAVLLEAAYFTPIFHGVKFWSFTQQSFAQKVNVWHNKKAYSLYGPRKGSINNAWCDSLQLGLILTCQLLAASSCLNWYSQHTCHGTQCPPVLLGGPSKDPRMWQWKESKAHYQSVSTDRRAEASSWSKQNFCDLNTFMENDGTVRDFFY